MKLYSILSLSLYVLCVSCSEQLEDYSNIVKPAVDSAYIAAVTEAPQTKKILIEEFTGVKCQNCPTGHTEVKNLIAANPDKIIAISLHSNFLGTKYSFSQFDLLNEEAEKLYKEYGASSKPAAMIDRVKYNNLQVLSRTEWSAALTPLKTKTTPVNIHIKNTYSESKRSVRVRATIHFTENMADDLKYTVFVVENNITTAQLQPDGTIDTFYKHAHVLRKTLTDFNGNTLAAPIVKSKTFIKEFDYILKADQKAENMQIAVAVHKSGVVKDVLHCEEEFIK